MTLRHQVLRPNSVWHAQAVHTAICVQTGRLNKSGEPYRVGDGFYVVHQDQIAAGSESGATFLSFEISTTPQNSADCMETAKFDWHTKQAILRLDCVTFPPKARAHRHVHPGPGIRCLVEGQLEIKSDYATMNIQEMSAWFEDAHSPVQATAGTIVAAFVRAMILPASYEGRPSLQHLDPADDEKPRLQTNQRFFDHAISLPLD